MSYFLNFCFYKDSIFGGWLPFVALCLCKWSYRDELVKIPFKKSERDSYIKALMTIVEDNAIYKILGGCITCANVWHCMIVFNVVFWLTWCNGFVNGWWYVAILPYIFFSSFIVRKISKDE